MEGHTSIRANSPLKRIDVAETPPERASFNCTTAEFSRVASRKVNCLARVLLLLIPAQATVTSVLLSHQRQNYLN